MGSKAHQVTVIVIGLSVNQDEIRPEVAVAMICPLPGKRVVTMTLLDFSVFRQFGHHMSQIRIKTFSEPPPFFPPKIPSESSGSSNRPHSDRSSGR